MALFEMNRFHLIAALTWQFTIFFGTQMLFPIFSTYVPRWRCASPDFLDMNKHTFSKNCTLFMECRNFIEFENNYFHSAAMEFDWICGSTAYFRALYSQVQFFGVLVGTVSFGVLSDFFGRKPLSIFLLTFGNAAVARSLLGFMIGGSLVVLSTFVMEMLLPTQRMALRAFFNWGIARLAMTIICYYFPDWRTASIVCGCCSLPAVILIIFVFPESPTWLHTKVITVILLKIFKNKIEQMQKSEKWIAKVAGIPYVPVEHEVLPAKTVSKFEMLRDKEYLRRIVVLWLMWFTASVCGYAIDLNSTNIVGNLFLNQSLFSILIAFSKIFLVIYDTYNKNFNRRKLHQHAQFVVVVCFFILTVLVYFNEHVSYINFIRNLILGHICFNYKFTGHYFHGIHLGRLLLMCN